jgi:hypothetical protein
MKAAWTRYLNEIVGLTVMALMTIALIAGQTQATGSKFAQEEARPILEIRLTISD